MELCFLSAVYTNLLITKQPMDFYFKPYPDSFPNNVLRVSPDILPEGSIFIEKCWIDGEEYKDFDAFGLTVQLPSGGDRRTVKVRISPASWMDRKQVG